MTQTPDPDYELHRRKLVRAQWTLNILVILTACASSMFLVYVIAKILPTFRTAPEVEVPTAQPAAREALLRAELDTGGRRLRMELHDLDLAPGYREEYGKRVLGDMGIAQGRVYRLVITNRSAQPLTLAALELTVDAETGALSLRWPQALSEADATNARGRLFLTQSRLPIELQAGQGREVFLVGPPEAPPVDKLKGGHARADGIELKFEHVETAFNNN